VSANTVFVASAERTIRLSPPQIVTQVSEFGIQHRPAIKGWVWSREWLFGEESWPLQCVLDREYCCYRRRELADTSSSMPRSLFLPRREDVDLQCSPLKELCLFVEYKTTSLSHCMYSHRYFNADETTEGDDDQTYLYSSLCP